MMGCASSIHISDRVVYHSGKESEDSHSPQQNCPQPGHIKPNNACQRISRSCARLEFDAASYSSRALACDAVSRVSRVSQQR
ncbi:high affinity cAMP-specific and IBMX-insensitive 3, 5 -cyclic phosphodiesterase 8A-like protein [Labeo rohita]|uniref:High affinity cAMP-specific and IBMX-insensitive 3, 5-cyclic phosphodiesterase 8A-like protein n=1 Tax=Labeo rohita TaxID=84645 RepID=A0A498NY11_LABRO|nr:high affinity cAMP-specific and IBMX-insensitive 3, 5 -cyclic phosphodiesterase 8A-like protein [Labeo rohita]